MFERVLFPEVDTPAFLIDVDGLDRNLRKMAQFAQENSVDLRPHFKSHRIEAISKRQVALGARGITCAKLAEAEVLSQRGFEHLLIANQPVGPQKHQRLAQLGRKHKVTVGVDNLEVARHLAATAREMKSTVGVLVEVNIGLNRCGVAPGEPAVQLALRCSELKGLRFRGFMGYEGHVVMLSRPEKVAAAQAALSLLTDTAAAARAAGLNVPVVSAGGTGSWDITGTHVGVTELQCGTYSLMDLLFRDQAGADFEQACWVLATVISRPAADRAILDCGKKSMHPSFGMAVAVDHPGATLTALHSEHGILQLTGEATNLQVGDRVRLAPYYLEGTVNLHEQAYAVRDGRVVEEWPVTGRGLSR